MKRPVAAILAVVAGAFLAAPASADELSDAYEQVMQDPGNTAVNLRYAEIAERVGKDRLALATYERILANDPDNPEAAEGMHRILRKLQPANTRWVASLGAGWESNPANAHDNEQDSAIILGSVAMRDVRNWGNTGWQTDALAVVDVVANDDRLNYGFIGAETGPVWNTHSWFTVHPALGVGVSYYDNTTFYTEVFGSTTLEGITMGANQVVRLKVGYRNYSHTFTTDSGYYVHLDSRWSIPHIFGEQDVFMISPWFRWSDIEGGIPVTASAQAEPGRYAEVGTDFAYYTPISTNLVGGLNVTVSQRNYRDPGLGSGNDDRHDFNVTPGATLIVKHIIWYQSDLRFNYRHRFNDSNDHFRDFNDDIITANIDTRF